jgi:hypothetical protein
VYTDPSGHFFGIDDILIGAAIGALVGGTTSAITGGDIGKGMLFGGITGGIFGAAGGIISNVNSAAQISAMDAFFSASATVSAGLSTVAQAGIHATAGAIAGGINAAIGHEDIGLGMLTGGISGGMGRIAGGFLPGGFGYQFAGRTVIGGVTGGISSEIYGGSFRRGFEMGARTGAIGFMANGWLHDKFLPWLKSSFKGVYVDENGMLVIVGGGYLTNAEGRVYPYYCGGLGFGLSATVGDSGFTPGDTFAALQVSVGPMTAQGGYGFKSGWFSESGVATGGTFSASVCYISKQPLNR